MAWFSLNASPVSSNAVYMPSDFTLPLLTLNHLLTARIDQ